MKLLIRADASTEIGSGHLMRCLAVAQAWKALEGAVHLVTTAAPSMHLRWCNEGCTSQSLNSLPGSSDDAKELASVAREWSASWVLLDGYKFGDVYQLNICQQAPRVAAIDDFGTAQRDLFKVVVNQNSYATPALYGPRGGDLLLGSRYALLRSEFVGTPRSVATAADRACRVLVSMGGGDPNNVTKRVIDAVETVRDLDSLVVLGPNNVRAKEISRRAEGIQSMRVATDVQNMREHMEWCDFAIVATGSICWELAYLGVPALGIVTAENQKPVAQDLDRRGVLTNLGFYDRLSDASLRQHILDFKDHRDLRSGQKVAGQALVDGLGSQRVAAYFQSRC